MPRNLVRSIRTIRPSIGAYEEFGLVYCVARVATFATVNSDKISP